MPPAPSRRGRLRSLISRRRKRLLAAGGLLAALILAAVVVGLIYRHDRTGSIYHPKAPFVPQKTPSLPKAKVTDSFSWPNYGYSRDHTRDFPAPSFVRPPFKEIWVKNRGALLEFPPVIYGERIFQLADNGALAATNKHTGHTIWERKLGQLSASSPAVTSTTVYVTILQTGRSRYPGRVMALDTANGDIRWSRPLPSRSESSPIQYQGRIFFGTESGTVYALDDRNGEIVWTYHADGSVKASPTLSEGKLYFGDYSGHLQAVSVRTGKRLWISSSEGALLGSGTFYSTAAVFYDRVFLGNTDGRIYAYDASNGHLDWAVQTGAYVYSSPAVTNAPGLGPTIYLGSYDGTFYALNARTGHIDWHFDAHGRISGSATIIGDIVYFSVLGTHQTYGLGISTGRVVFRKETGAFDPVISDGRDIYLTGYTGIYGLEPEDAPPLQEPEPSKTRPTEKRAATSKKPG